MYLYLIKSKFECCRCWSWCFRLKSS